MEINDRITVFLTHSNVDFSLMKQTNTELGVEFLMQHQQVVKSNVAIASAVTAYARIEMFQYKTLGLGEIFYTDTDSIITDFELPAHMVGTDLGLVKDELAGNRIKEAYFFGVKKYAFIDHAGQVKTVFSGIARNTLT